MKREKLLNINSAEYDKAEAVAFFHAVVAPVFIAIFSHFIGGDALITGLVYTFLMSALNLYRSLGNDVFLEEKSEMYFEHLKYLFIFCFFAALLLIGVPNV